MSNPQVALHIQDMGTITLELDEEHAPITVANFLNYVKSGHYDGVIFHRVIEDFMIQGGGFDVEMKEKETGDPIENEADNGLENAHYTVAMARTSDPHSASAQFFINTTDNDFLNHTGKTSSGWGYAVFGKVVGGEDIVDQINTVKTTRRNFHDDVPKQNVVIESAEVLE
jgi:peptidyl-prolyl cis-trans isomerase B (cyclophilin B)